MTTVNSYQAFLLNDLGVQPPTTKTVFNAMNQYFSAIKATNTGALSPATNPFATQKLAGLLSSAPKRFTQDDATADLSRYGIGFLDA